MAWKYVGRQNDPGSVGDGAYRTLMQPENPTVPCCGEGDAYLCDEVHVRDRHTFCNITDDRRDELLMRAHIDVGTEIAIPENKLKWDRGNPTGHAVHDGLPIMVYCFVQSGGV